MGNIISNAASLGTSMDLAGGDTKVKQKLSVIGASTFTGDSTFNGNLSVTNGKFNNVDVPTLNTDVTKLKTDLTAINTTLTNVSAGSFAGKAISGATDVTATGTGTFNAVSTNNIDINGDILSSTGKKYLVGNDTTGLSLTNGQTDVVKATSFALKADGSSVLTTAPGKTMKINEMIVSRTENVFSKGTYLTSLSGLLDVKSNTLTAVATVSADTVSATNNVTAKAVTTTGLITGGGGVKAASLTVDGASTLTGVTTATGQINANGGVKAASLTVDGASTLTGVTTATGQFIGNGGVKAASLIIDGTSTLTGATTATGLITASGGVKASTLTVDGATTATGQITASGGVKASTLTVDGVSTHTGVSTFANDLNTKNVVIGTQKWLIEEVADVNKGTRLCFGKSDAQGTKTYWTCMNNTGNLELF